jgi:Distinct helicase family with a unique C-terminal domain including a metal-binding cysteine cluster
MSIKMDNTRIFNNKAAVDNLVQCLSDRKLKPFPHIGVVGPNPHRENTSSIFTDSTQIPPYVVGYKVELKAEGTQSLSTSFFEFTVRKSLSDDDSGFDVYRIELRTDLQNFTTVAIVYNISTDEQSEIPLIKKETGKRTSFEGDFVNEYIFSYEKNGEKKTTRWNLHVNIKKSILKSTDHLFDIETKFTNESDAEQITGDIVELEADDEVPTEYVKTGYLMNINLREELTNAEFVRNDKGTPIRRLFNVVPERDLGSPTQITFKDYYIGYEKILKLKPSHRTISQFITEYNNTTNQSNRISPLIGKVFSSVFRSNEARFHKYQEEGISHILEEISNRSGRVKVISVRTAGGKTETFMVPVIQYCIDNLNVIGTKALVFYPTKALANDQAKRIFKALYFTNKELQRNGQRKITMALYHGDIEQHSKDDIGWVPFKCIKDECNSPLEVVSEGINNTLVCPLCEEKYDYVYVTRDESHRKLPDILITNPDTLTWVLSRNGEKHSLLGRKIKYCSSCGFPHKNLKARKCSRNECTGSLIDVQPECVPELIIFDEVHLFGGAFGISVSQFLKRLNGVIKQYHEKIYGAHKEYKPVYIASTATIKDPRDFASKFFNTSKDNVDLIPSSTNTSDIYEDLSKSEISRYNLFILPRAYLAKQTTALAVKFLLDYSQTLPNFKPRILGFSNSLRDCNDLIAETRARYDGTFNIDGHNTQYDSEERSEREVLFNKGDVSVLYATSTLEVGVDFEAMHALIIFGPPYSFNDYLQRIGRAGRNSDAVVITVIKLNNPVDYFYYENCYELVSNPMNYTERVPISSYNPHVERKQVISTFFDFIQIQDNSHEYDDYKFFNSTFFTGAYWRPAQIKLVKNYIKSIFDIKDDLLDEILEDLKDQIFSQAEETPKKTLGDIFDHVLEKTEFTNLRSSDPVVEVNYIFGEA